MESLEACLVPLLVEKTPPPSSSPAAVLAVLLGPFADQCEIVCNCGSKAPAQLLRLREDDPAAERGLLGSQHTQDGAASKEKRGLQSSR